MPRATTDVSDELGLDELASGIMSPELRQFRKAPATIPGRPSPRTGGWSVNKTRHVEVRTRRPPPLRPAVSSVQTEMQYPRNNTPTVDLVEDSDGESFTKASKSARIVTALETKSESPYFSADGSGQPNIALENSTKVSAPKQDKPCSPKNAKAAISSSPDALQDVGSNESNYLKVAPVPLYKASASDLALSISGQEEHLGGSSGSFHLANDTARICSRRKSLVRKSTRPKAKVSGCSAQKASPKELSLSGLRYGYVPCDRQYKLHINEDEQYISIDLADSPLSASNGPIHTVPFNKITRVIHDADEFTVLMLQISFSKGLPANKMGLKMASHKDAYDLLRVLQTSSAGSGIDVLVKGRYCIHDIFYSCWTSELINSRDWAQRAFDAYESHTDIRQSSPEQQQTPTISHHFVKPSTTIISGKRKKKKDLLQEHEGSKPSFPDSPLQTNATIITGKDRGSSAFLEGHARMGDQATPPTPHPAPPQLGKLSGSTTRLPRATRSSREANLPKSDHSDGNKKEPKIKFSQTGQLGTPWKRPLVYPKIGKKRETVDFADLERLDDDEFLNDNLIGFFLRYLEHYMERRIPETAKKIYFFNSYFYERLTHGTKGKKSINHEGVQKWTRAIDIFSRDFVVVPVNESLHWYVAIICNLSNLPRKLDESDNEENEEGHLSCEIGKPLETDGFVQLDLDVMNLDQPTERARENLQDLNLADGGVTSPVATKAEGKTHSTLSSLNARKSGNSRRKSLRHSLPKYDPTAPIIITLDSLGLGHSQTISALRQYVVEEGKQKRSLDIDGTIIKGMTAKGIPGQKNYSDCGLFLCAYMERFVLDPYGFVTSILQRELFEKRDWPVMESADLRNRLRDLVMELQREQEGKESQVPIKEVGKILLGKPRTPTPEPENEPSNEHYKESTPRGFQQRPLLPASLCQSEQQLFASSSRVSRSGLRDGERPKPSISADDDTRNAATDMDSAVKSGKGQGSPTAQHSPIVIDEDAPPYPGLGHVPSTEKHPQAFVDPGGTLIGFGSDPVQLAEYLRRARSPGRHETRSASKRTEIVSGSATCARMRPDQRTAKGVPDSQGDIEPRPEQHQYKAQEILPGLE